MKTFALLGLLASSVATAAATNASYADHYADVHFSNALGEVRPAPPPAAIIDYARGPQDTAPITADFYNELEYYMNFSQVAACVGYAGIKKPFNCKVEGCKILQGHVELVSMLSPPELQQFNVSGYIALDHLKKNIVLVTRGTLDIRDILTDVNILYRKMSPVDFAPNLQSENLKCDGCKIHDGFLHSYLTTKEFVDPIVAQLKSQHPEYGMVVTGHSLGGATALLFGLDYKINGYDPLVITSGQPYVGNQAFADYHDTVWFGKPNPDTVTVGGDRKFYRLTHLHDIVPRVPYWGGYMQVSGEIFIDYHKTHPPVDKVLACAGQLNNHCTHGSPWWTLFNLLDHFWYIEPFVPCF
uniref:triacylglycerol lipase n=1 Tax=Yarrowia alimentaria TaxID=479092 RepID=A0A078BMP6_9ASCO|nr:lipase [Yarrowia alimentaria]